MKRLSWKYVAGLIDGEGCIDIQTVYNKRLGYRNSFRPRVRVAMAENAKFVLDMLHNSYGGYLGFREHKNPNWQNAYSWELVGYSKTISFLRNIVNHLYIKKEQVRFLIWMETNLKGKQLNENVINIVKEELKLQKRDPHRLSEVAQERILGML